MKCGNSRRVVVDDAIFVPDITNTWVALDAGEYELSAPGATRLQLERPESQVVQLRPETLRELGRRHKIRLAESA